MSRYSHVLKIIMPFQTVEAAKECGMASVVVAGRKPLYEMKAADLVVKRLSELRVINLQQLFRNEELVTGNVSSLQLDLSSPYR